MSLNDIKYVDSLLVVKNALSHDQCDRLIHEFEDRIKIENGVYESCPHAVTGEKTFSTFKKLNLFPESDNFDVVKKTVSDIIKRWIEHLDQKKSFHVHSLRRLLNFAHEFRLLRYNEGDKIHPHTDWDHFTHASFSLNLNDDYQGGTMEFFNGKHSIRLGRGDAIIFPADSFWVHEIKPIEKGTRYSVNGFIISVPEKQRKILNDIAHDIYDCEANEYRF